MVPAERRGTSSRSRPTKRVADGDLDIAADKPARLSLPPQWGRYRLDVKSNDPTARSPRCSSTPAAMPTARADTPDLLEIALDKPDYKPGDTMTVAVTARTAGKLTLNVFGDRLLTTQTQTSRKARRRSNFRSARTGAPAPMWSRPCAGRSTRRRSACRAAPSACNGSPSTRRRARSRSI